MGWFVLYLLVIIGEFEKITSTNPEAELKCSTTGVTLGIAQRQSNVVFGNEIDSVPQTDHKRFTRSDSPNSLHNAFSESSDKKIKETFDLLKEGEKKIELNNKYRNAILVLGHTGSGKTTFTNWIAGDDTKLISRNDPTTPGGFIIQDQNDKIGINTITSKTIFPELLVDNSTDQAFYDFPGFSDTRGVANDIATTYFIKKVLDFTEGVKFLFVVNYNSVTGQGTRKDFTDLIRYASDLIKDFEKFQNSIAIVATKVRNEVDFETTAQTGQLVFVQDDVFIKSIGTFLGSVKQELLKNIGDPYISNAMKFIDSLLVKNGGVYSRIGIFRVPDRAGPLSDIPLLQEGKNHIKTLINKNIKYTTKTDDDFGYTLPGDTKNDIGDIIEAINNNILFDINKITIIINKYYHTSVERILMKLQYFITSRNTVDAAPSEAQSFSTTISKGRDMIECLIEDISGIENPAQLAKKINETTTSLGIDIQEDIISNLSDQGNYLQFFKMISGKSPSTNQWVGAFRGILTYISDSEKNIQDNVDNVAARINGTIKTIIQTIVANTKKHYDNEMKLCNIQDLLPELDKAHLIILNTTNEITDSTTVEELSYRISEIFYILNIDMPRDIFLNLGNQGRYYDFLRVVSNKELHFGSFARSRPFEDLVEYLDSSEKWYRFLNNMFERFSEFEIQEDLSKYDVANIEDWGQKGKSPGIWITQNSLKRFLQIMSRYNLTKDYDIQNIDITEVQLGSLNRVLSMTLKQRVEKLCPTSDELVILGEFVKLSDIKENTCNGTLRSIKIFSMNKFFIDKNLTEIGDRIQLSIIAPTWDIIDHHEIELNGSPGKEFHPPKAVNVNAAPGSTGVDGKPGLPGGPGGNFLGIGHIFMNIKMLTISLNGGKGGMGQHGADGMKGVDGKKPRVPDSETRGIYSGWTQEGFDAILVDPDYRCTTNPVVICKKADYGLWYVYGTNCSSGGNGGNGGHGGYGGNPGKFIFIPLVQDITLGISNETGETGQHGEGGWGGEPGVRGQLLKVKENLEPAGFLSLKFISVYTGASWEGLLVCKQGNHGRSIVDQTNIKLPDHNKFSNPASIINDYKTHLRERLIGNIRERYLRNFLEYLDNNHLVTDLYDALRFVDELQSLENQFYKFSDKISFLPFYRSLLTRIDHFIASNSIKYDKIFDYLRIATYSKIYSIQNDWENYLVVDITSYFGLVKKHIEQYNLALKKVEIIKYKTIYRMAIESQINEAEILIEENILPTIDELYIQIDNQISILVQDVINEQQKSGKKLKDLIAKQNELSRQLPLMGFLGVLKYSSQLLAFAGPVGIGATTLVGVATDALQNKIDPEAILNAVDKPLQKVTNYYKSEQGLLKINLDIAKQKLSKELLDKDDDDLKLVRDEINSVSKNLDADFSNPETLSEMKQTLVDLAAREEASANQIKAEIPDEKDKLDHETTEKIEKIEKKVRIATYLRNAVTIAEVGFNSLGKIKEAADLISATGESIRQVSDEIDKLKLFEKRIYQSMVPARNQLQSNLERMVDDSSGKSLAGLDVSEWQIQNIIKDFQFQMQDMLQESVNVTLQAKLKRCLDEVQEGMLAMIQVYNRIQEYQDKAKLANYIADLNSEGEITDTEELKNAIYHLELITKSNLILQEYEKASSAFKQYIFPFAGLYLDRFDLSLYIDDSMNISDVVYHVKRQVEFLTDELTLDSTIIREKPYRIFPDIQFHYEAIDQSPFSEWKYNSNKYQISRLLQGHKIVLQADITQGVQQNAIKFREIGIGFRLMNKTSQNNFDEQLKHFLVNMRHSGTSHYRCDNHYYIIEHEKIDMKHSVTRNKSGSYFYLDKTSSIIKSNTPIFSPYTQWEMQLSSKDPNKYGFDVLEQFANQDIDLALEGLGQYIELELDVCDDNLNNYYEMFIQMRST